MTATDSKTDVKATAKKGVQVHATIDAELFTKLEDHRWDVRLNMVDVVKLALTQYAEREGLIPGDETSLPFGASPAETLKPVSKEVYADSDSVKAELNATVGKSAKA